MSHYPDVKPNITIKMCQSEPHRVCASVRINSEGNAVGYFIDEHDHPAFTMDIDPELYKFIISSLSQLTKGDPEAPNQPDNWFAIIVANHGQNAQVAFYEISFEDGGRLSGISQRLVQIYSDGRKHLMQA